MGRTGEKTPPPKSEDDKRGELLKALAACGNNKSKTARMLGVSRKTLYVWMDTLQGFPLSCLFSRFTALWQVTEHMADT